MPDTLDGILRIPKVFRNFYAWWIKKSYMKSDYLVVVNPISIEKLSKMGYPKEKIFYVPNFVSNKTFYNMTNNDIKMNRRKYGYKDDDFIAIGVGQLHKGKGVLDFIKCAKENPDIKFIWVGGFPFGKLMEGYNEIKKVYDNPPENLRFTGIVPHEEVNALCNISDIFFFPSFCENFPLVVIEASNTGKPLLLRSIEEYEGIYFDKYLKGNSVDEFNKLLRKLKTDKKLYKQYQKYSKDLANYYSEDNICKMWIDLYKKISK
jgi:1,2-diacylglycerol-3-alpha-glucose alpha-1,2-galactosyltransferase